MVRSAVAALGALWSGIAFVAGGGNPFVMAAFAVVYMLPMLYRFTQSAHAVRWMDTCFPQGLMLTNMGQRSGAVGCLSFTVISLGLVTVEEHDSVAMVVVIRGATFAVGVVAAIFINWLLWPFVARHELRKAVSTMMFFLSVVYRSKSSLGKGCRARGLIQYAAGVVGRYLYYEEGQEPSPEDIQHSEILEGRMREGFVRIRQLMVSNGDHSARLSSILPRIGIYRRADQESRL